MRTLTEEQKGVLETYYKTTNQIKISGFSPETPIEIIKDSTQALKSLKLLNDYETLIDDCNRYLEELMMKEEK